LGRAVTIALWRANNKPPVELVVANLEKASKTAGVSKRRRLPFYSLFTRVFQQYDSSRLLRFS